MSPRFLLAAALLAAVPAGAQDAPEVDITITEGIERYSLALAPLSGDAEVDRAVRGVVRDDLLFSGLFDVVPEAAATYQVQGTIEPHEGQHVITFSLQEKGGAVVTARRLRGRSDSLRRIGHVMADSIVTAITGRPSSFDSRIAFVRQRGEGRDVWVMDYDGANLVRVTADDVLVLSPEVSMDGRSLLFTSYASGKPGVYVVRRETGEVRRLFQREGLNQSPSFSPDAAEIAFSATFDGNSEIYVSDPTGRTVRRLTTHPSIDVSPTWSPTSREIAFTSDRGGSPQVYAMSAEGLDVRRLTLEGSYNTDPAWSPDGTMLAYTSRVDGRFQVAVLDLLTRTVSYLTSGRHDSEQPSWSPDGQYLAFTSNRTGAYDLWVIRREGGEPRRVGPGGGSMFPSWYR